MTSFNHYSLGSVADWIHATVGGLKPTAPAWHQFEVAPRPGGNLTSAKASHETPFGTAKVEWNYTDGKLSVSVDVPYGATAKVDIPGYDTVELRDGHYENSFDYQAS